jgi:hypothetical protein
MIRWPISRLGDDLLASGQKKPSDQERTPIQMRGPTIVALFQ